MQNSPFFKGTGMKLPTLLQKRLPNIGQVFFSKVNKGVTLKKKQPTFQHFFSLDELDFVVL